MPLAEYLIVLEELLGIDLTLCVRWGINVPIGLTLWLCRAVPCAIEENGKLLHLTPIPKTRFEA